MFIFKSKKGKQKERAKELVRLCKKVDAYRWDVMDEGDLKELRAARDALLEQMGAKDYNHNGMESAMARLDRIMKKVGGHMYPVGFWADNIEVFLVASILAIGIRTFFLQPFAIPTNSMYPTYNGMIPKVYQEGEAKPGVVERVWNKVVKGAAHYHIEAPADGEIEIPLSTPEQLMHGAVGYMPYRQVWGTRMLVIPTHKREYTVYVGGKPVSFVVPEDFGIEQVVTDQFFPEIGDYGTLLGIAAKAGMIKMKDGVMYLSTGKQVKKGDTVMHFDIIAGDMLFVDRFTYHFVSPKIGDPVVFPTKNIEGMKGPNGRPVEKYFIKRLVGEGGDILHVEEPYLMRNGERIEGAEAFEKNHAEEGNYRGYKAMVRMANGAKEVIPEGYYYAMGDNSPYSKDSRFWGMVPEKEVIGRAVFIFYPFSDHWGLSK